jgi:hypothetical protein
MKSLDAKSLLVAALVGALILWLIVKTKRSALIGAIVGTGVQFVVRLIGVS